MGAGGFIFFYQDCIVIAKEHYNHIRRVQYSSGGKYPRPAFYAAIGWPFSYSGICMSG